MKNIIYIFILFLFVSSCETLDLEQTENKSATSALLLDPVYTFNYVQVQLPEFVDAANNFTQRVTRQMAMTGGNTYDNAFAPVNFNNVWFLGYNILNAVKAMEPKSIELKYNYSYGASRVIRAYVLLTLTDMFGNIPVTEALQGNKNLTPKYDSSESVYKIILQELDDAILLLSTPQSPKLKNTDLYYKNQASWITLANTLKLKMLINAKLSGNEIGYPNIGPAINQIVLQNNIIDTVDEDFIFRYGNSRFSPNTRHPLYNDQYELGGGAYIGNYIMWSMTLEKGLTSNSVDLVKDPRTDFYFYRQDDQLNSLNDFTLPKLTRPLHFSDQRYSSFFNDTRATYKVSNWVGQVAIPGSGFLGRDHGDNSGIPPDNDIRAVGGLYPIGGKLGGIYGKVPNSTQTSGEAGKKGQGIMPILLSSYVHFMIAEAVLTVGVSGNAKSEFLLGINHSIDRVLTLSTDYPENNLKSEGLIPGIAEGLYPIGSLIINGLPNTAEIKNFSSFYKINTLERNDYIGYVSGVYDGLSSDKKLEFIIKEFYIASWGNGIEPYNNYRRTGYPSNFQPTLELTDDSFYSTALYPGSAVNNNPNVPTNVRTRKVFWDKATFTTPLH